MPKFRKKPIIVEAEQFDGSPQSADKLSRWYASDVWPDFDEHGEFTGHLAVMTPEGKVLAEAGDWIITGVAGERYPCKPKIFELTFERIGS